MSEPDNRRSFDTPRCRLQIRIPACRLLSSEPPNKSWVPVEGVTLQKVTRQALVSQKCGRGVKHRGCFNSIHNLLRGRTFGTHLQRIR